MDVDFDRINHNFVKRHEDIEEGSGVLEQIAEVFGLSRSQVKSLLEKGRIEFKMERAGKSMEVFYYADGIPFVEMAADGSLKDCGFDENCGSWMTEWIAEAKSFSVRDNPAMDYLAYTIALKDEMVKSRLSPKVIGSVGCSYYEDLGETGITYFIGAQYRNNGYAVEAVNAYMEYFFKRYDVKRMIATVRNENIPSWKVIEKAGFILVETRMYQDITDDKEELYRFYEISPTD